jgi:predicted DNA-binding protein
MYKRNELVEQQEGRRKDATSVVFLRLPKDEAERLRNRAKSDSRTITDTVRLAINAFLADRTIG